MSFLVFDPFLDPGSFSVLLSVLEENTFPHLDRTNTLSGKAETSKMQKGGRESGVLNFTPILTNLRKSHSNSLPEFTYLCPHIKWGDKLKLKGLSHLRNT